MKPIQFVILSLIICAFNSTIVHAQNLNLIIEGNDELETAVIDSLSYQKTFLNYNSLKTEINKVHSKLIKTGFIESILYSTSKKNDSTYLAKFNLKKKYYTIYIYYNNKHLSKDLLESVANEVTSEYFITTIAKSEAILNYINSKVTEKGFPFVAFKLENIKKKDTNNLQADLFVLENSARTIDNIIIKGYEEFPKAFIKRYLKIRTTDAFNLNLIKQKTELLNTLAFANQTKSPEVLFTKDSTAIYLYVEKNKSNSFDGFLGFGTNEATNKIEFDGYLNLSLINNLNYGEYFNLQYKSDESEQKTFEVNINLPYIFGSSIGTELKLNIFKKDSSYTTVNQSASIFYQINSKHRMFAGINTIESNKLLEDNSSLDIQDYSSLFYELRYDFKEIQVYDLLFPINTLFDFKAGFGNREHQNTKESQALIKLNAFKIFNLDDKNSFYIRLSGTNLISDNYLQNVYLRL